MTEVPGILTIVLPGNYSWAEGTQAFGPDILMFAAPVICYFKIIVFLPSVCPILIIKLPGRALAALVVSLSK